MKIKANSFTQYESKVREVLEAKYHVSTFKTVSISRIKGDALSTATGNGLHNAMFSNRGTEAVLNITKVDGSKITLHINI